jgi:hypothetical protein
MTAPTDLRALDIRVLGTPRPKGSLRPFVATNGKPRAREQLAGSPDWRRSVTDTAYQAIRCDCDEPDCTILKPGYPRTGPVKVIIELEFVPPKKRSGPYPHTRTTGDADKHARNILDSLQDAGVVKDDAAVVDLRVTKRWSDTGVAGARIVVWPVVEAVPHA